MGYKYLEEFFLEAASATYVGKAKKTTIAELPDSNVYPYQVGELSYRDIYWTNGERSGGTTLIHEHGKLVWIMSYNGWCQNNDPEVLTFLKQALRSAYEQRLFYGGRGRSAYYQTKQGMPGLVYHNWPDFGLDNGFREFHGREHIQRFPDVVNTLFWHRYQGLLLKR